MGALKTLLDAELDGTAEDDGEGDDSGGDDVAGSEQRARAAPPTTHSRASVYIAQKSLRKKLRASSPPSFVFLA